MEYSDEQVVAALTEKEVLIVEDNTSLAEKMERVFSQFPGSDVAVTHSMESARGAMDQEGPFGLVVLDVMLPATEDDYERNLEYEEIMKKAKNTIRRIGTSPTNRTDRERLQDARFDRARAREAIEKLINDEGGITLAAEWRQSDDAGKQNMPILFLTAIGNEDTSERGLEKAKRRASWLLKPVSSKGILREAVELILNTD